MIDTKYCIPAMSVIVFVNAHEVNSYHYEACIVTKIMRIDHSGNCLCVCLSVHVSVTRILCPLLRVLTHYEQSGANYNGAKRRDIHMQAERSSAIYQSLWRTLKCIPAAGRCKK